MTSVRQGQPGELDSVHPMMDTFGGSDVVYVFNSALFTRRAPAAQASRKVSIESVVVSLQGGIRQDVWVY